jgi:hypothetical protein
MSRNQPNVSIAELDLDFVVVAILAAGNVAIYIGDAPWSIFSFLPTTGVASGIIPRATGWPVPVHVIVAYLEIRLT